MPGGCEYLIPFFWELSTERQIGMTVGPIPVSKISERAERKGFDAANIKVIEIVIQVLDAAYMEWARNDVERKTQKQKPSPPPSGWGKHRSRR